MIQTINGIRIGGHPNQSIIDLITAAFTLGLESKLKGETGFSGVEQVIPISTNVAVMDWNLWNHGYIELTEDIYTFTFTLNSSGSAQAGTIIIIQGGAGAHAVNGWDTAIQWVNANEPLIPSFPGEGVICSFRYSHNFGKFIGSWSLLQ